EGKLKAKAYTALWHLAEDNIRVVPITGRPAGWCEMIARFWPVDGIIGENGALYFRYLDDTKKMLRYFAVDEATRLKNSRRLEQIKGEILQEVPGAAIASDQFTRLFDLAVDFCEDVPPLAKKDIQKIVDVFTRHGAEAKVSSIHVNGWFGQYDKLTACKVYCQREFG
ncbi:MAG: HAD family hydrolase, partial [Bdellovibrionales bacterium]|nr:HAD family hydrolase [Bdellovibrionales bacterium]